MSKMKNGQSSKDAAKSVLNTITGGPAEAKTNEISKE